jgi:hypothetical protein
MMKTEEVMEVIYKHLEDAKSDAVRLKKVNELLDYFNYCKRLFSLTEDERIDFIGTMDGAPLTESERNTLENTKDNRVTYNYYVKMFARSTYFRRCNWLAYLHGDTDEKPKIYRHPQKAREV